MFSLSPFSHIASPLLYSSVSIIFWWNETVMFNRLTARINQRKVTYSRYNHIEKVYEVLGRTSPQQKRRGSKKPLCINPWQIEDSRGVLPEPRDCQLFSWRPTLFYLCFPSPFSNVDPGSRNSPKESGFTICKMNDTFPSSWNKECFFNNNFLRVVFCLWALRTYTVRSSDKNIFQLDSRHLLDTKGSRRTFLAQVQDYVH